MFLLESTDRTKSLGGFTDHGTDKLGRELGQGSFFFVAHPMDGAAVGGFGSEGLFSSPIESLCKLHDSVFEGLFGFGCAREFEPQCHIHTHILYKGSCFPLRKHEIVKD
jgi:hypothetical protein